MLRALMLIKAFHCVTLIALVFALRCTFRRYSVMAIASFFFFFCLRQKENESKEFPAIFLLALPAA